LIVSAAEWERTKRLTTAVFASRISGTSSRSLFVHMKMPFDLGRSVTTRCVHHAPESSRSFDDGDGRGAIVRCFSAPDDDAVARTPSVAATRRARAREEGECEGGAEGERARRHDMCGHPARVRPARGEVRASPWSMVVRSLASCISIALFCSSSENNITR
jgi:hypothetical protein